MSSRAQTLITKTPSPAVLELAPLSRRWEVGCFVALALFAVAGVLLLASYPNFDTYYHLVWGRELVAGHKPSFNAYLAPTEHPLWLGLSALFGVLFNSAADRAMVVLTVLALVALVWAVYRLGLVVFGFWSALAAIFFVATSFPFWVFAGRAYLDIPFLALVLWAGVCVAHRGQGRWLVVALLAVAGLLRPEAWLLAGLYWLWSWPQAGWGKRIAVAAAFAIGPAVWLGLDWWVTGDPLFSFHSTGELVDRLDRTQGVGALPGTLLPYLAAIVKPFVAALAVLGLGLALWRLGWRQVLVPLVLLLAGVLTFVATAVGGLAMIARYLTVPAVALCLLAGYGWLGFTRESAGTVCRRRWTWTAVAIAVAGVGYSVTQVERADRVLSELNYTGKLHQELVQVLTSPQVRVGRRCGPVTFPNYRLVPDARWILKADHGGVGARSAFRRQTGVAIYYVGAETLNRYGFAYGISPSVNVPDPGFMPAIRVGRFSAYVRC